MSALIRITQDDLERVEAADQVCEGEGIGPDLDDLVSRMKQALATSSSIADSPVDSSVLMARREAFKVAVKDLVRQAGHLAGESRDVKDFIARKTQTERLIIDFIIEWEPRT